MQELAHQTELGGGEERLDKERQGERMTARERVDFLLDSGYGFRVVLASEFVQA
jgi:methylmalonyl-CoA decarboxylase subunit alpha